MNDSGHVVELLDSAAAAEPDGIFLRGERVVRFGEVARRSHAVAAWLRGRGLMPGDRLLIVAANHADAVIAALGAARGGIPFVFLHPSIPPSGFRAVLSQVEPKCLVLDRATAALLPPYGGTAVLSSGESALPGMMPISSLVAAGALDGAGAPDTVKLDPLCLVFTSGSTGTPLGVMISHDNVLFTTAAIQHRLRYRHDDVIGLFLPLSFDYGLYQIFLALVARASLYFSPANVLYSDLPDLLEQEEITILPGVPTLFATLAAMQLRKRRSLRRLRALTNTGERLPDETLAALRSLLPQSDIYLMYGLTECKRVSILLPSELESRRGSVGRPLDGTAVEILNPQGNPLPAGRVGELAVSGPHMTIGYWRAPADTALRFGPSAIGQRRLFTGDTCWRDEDGYLYFKGRIGSQIKRHGFRISLLEIETAARGAPAVSGAAAVNGWPGSELCLFVTAEAPGLTAAAVLRHLRDHLEPYKIPDRISLVDSLPITPHGKIDRRRLAALAAQGLA
jgi:acyl-CoA synthetase (AMP-forming)/AMP-acid ligase II